MVFSQAAKKDSDVAIIEKVMAMQEQSWNEGNIDKFMEGYWNSDSLTFVGKKGITYGWKATLANYKKNYPDKETMGKLTFTLLKKERLGTGKLSCSWQMAPTTRCRRSGWLFLPHLEKN